MPPLALTDRRLDLVTRAAGALAVQHRDDFLRLVAARLSGEPTDIAVMVALDAALSTALENLSHNFDRAPNQQQKEFSDAQATRHS